MIAAMVYYANLLTDTNFYDFKGFLSENYYNQTIGVETNLIAEKVTRTGVRK